MHKTVALATVFHKENVNCFACFSCSQIYYDTTLLVVDMFPQTDDSWICFRKQRNRSKSVDMFPYTDDINLIATRHVETVVLMSTKD